MPWLIGTALVHSLIIAQKKKYLLSWVLLLGILAFLLSVIGTFLVRSGILTSVHTFALDPSRGIFILIFIALLGGYSLLMLLKSKKYPEIRHFSFLSKEGSILVNNIIMIIVCSSVFLGTTYPLIIETLTNSKISVGEPYYNSVIIPIIIPAILIMGIGPILSWDKDSNYKIFKKILPNIIFTIIVTLIIFSFYKTYSNLGAVGVVLSSWIISNNIILIFKKKISQSKGMIISHLGIGLLILGITGSSVWQEEKIIKMNLNSQTLINDYEVTFKEIKQVKKSNYVALRGIFEVKDKKNKFITNLKPENRFYPITNIFTSEASIYTNLLGDLYIVLGEGNINEGWIVRVYYNPLVIWLWIGAFAIFLGGVFSAINNLKFINFRK
jgi:cytochrome c-type biogenesis protein CcmF